VNTGTDRNGAAVLAFEEVTFAYRPQAPPVLDRLCLEVGSGTATVVLGPNGTGKSTLLHLASGWLRPGRGRVLLDGRPVHDYRRHELGRTLALVPQTERTPFDYTVLDHVLLARAPHLPTLGMPGPRDRRIAEGAVDAVGLGPLRDRSVATLSGGERQLALVARALAQQPRLLLLDEPTAHLDLAHKARLIGVLRDQLATGVTVVLTTHEPDVAAAVATHVVLVRHGQIYRAGPRDDVFTAEHLTTTYGVDVDLAQVNGRQVVLWTRP
jgi:iron complex transport system ATP-binding protein